MRFYKVTIHNAWPEVRHFFDDMRNLPFTLDQYGVDRYDFETQTTTPLNIFDPFVVELYREAKASNVTLDCTRLAEVSEHIADIFKDATKEHRYYTEFLDCAADAAAEILGEDATPEEVDSMVDELLDIIEGHSMNAAFVIEHVPSYFWCGDHLDRMTRGICECTFIAPEDNATPLSTVTAFINATLICEHGFEERIDGELRDVCYVTADVELIDGDTPTWERHRHVEGITESDWDISPLTSDSE